MGEGGNGNGNGGDTDLLPRPNIDIIRVRSAKKAHEVAALLNNLVRDVHDYEYIALIANRPDTEVLAAVACGEIIGASYSFKLDQHNEDELTPFEWPTPGDMATGRFGYVASVGVMPGFRGRRVGKTLIQYGLRFLTELDCMVAIALCWQSGDERTSLPLFLSLGFGEVEHRENAFLGVPCLKCGPSCACAAVEVARSLG